MTDLTRLLAAATIVAVLGLLLALWRAERRTDRAEAARDAALAARDAATAAANRHWMELRRAQERLARVRYGKGAPLDAEQHWATVPRETPDSNAGGHRALSAAERPTDLLPKLRGDLPTAVIPATPVPYRWKGER